MKNTSKIRLITTMLLISLLLLSGVANATGNINIRQLKEAQQLDKINPTGKNVFMNFKKSIIEESFIKKLESVSQIESFINDVAVSGLSLYNVPRLSKSIANKIKQFVISGNITPAKGDELVRKLKGMQRSNLKRDRVYLCGECGEDCDLAKFITANIGESYETATISANDNTNKTFLKSQDAIVQNDYANMVQSFDVCLAEINRLITKMPDVKSCKCEGEECYMVYHNLYNEYLFLKKYMTIQKGYFLLKKERYSEAETYFRSQTTPSTAAVTMAAARLSMAAEKKAMIKWNEEVIRIMLTHFIGRCLYEQSKYSEALKYFNDSTILKIPQPPPTIFDDLNHMITTYARYPYSGLYSDFSIYDDAEREKHTGKSFLWVWQGYYFSGIANYKLGNKKDALAFLKAYIASPDKEFESEAKKLITELETEPNIPVPVEISELKFLRSDGTEVKWGDILETKMTYIVQAVTKNSIAEHSIKINYSSNFCNGSWDLQKLQNNNNTYQATVKIDSNIIGLNPENKWTFVAFDYLSDGKSNLGDSKTFIENAKKQMNYIDSGYFQASNLGIPNEIKEDDLAPVLPITKEAFMTAGVEYLKLEAGNIKKIIPFKNQANMLYYSGHGSSSDGSLAANVFFNPEDIQNNEWDNLRVVIIAGCSVLSLDIQLQIPDAAYKDDPGLKWVELGKKSKLKYFLGYRKTAPRDNQPTGNTTVPASKIICNNFFNNLKNQTTGSLIDWCSAWMEANHNANGWNACAIELKTKDDEKNKYHYILKIVYLGYYPTHKKITKVF